MEPLIPVTPSLQIQGSAISSTSKPEGAQVVFFSIVWVPVSVWILLNGILGWKWTLTEGWVRWNIDNHFCFFSSPNGMTHGNSHFLLPASTWLHYRQTAGDWICFWGWVTTLFLSHSARGKGVRGGHLNAEEGLEISLLYRDDGK